MEGRSSARLRRYAPTGICGTLRLKYQAARSGFYFSLAPRFSGVLMLDGERAGRESAVRCRVYARCVHWLFATAGACGLPKPFQPVGRRARCSARARSRPRRQLGGH